MKKLKISGSSFFMVGFLLLASSLGNAADMADYTSYPAYMTATTTPNVMIILDNSGSMNRQAYGSYHGNGYAVINQPYPCGTTAISYVQSAEDDAEEWLSGGSVGSSWISGGDDLDFGKDQAGDLVAVGLRFQNVIIPQGAVVTNAYIEFKAYGAESTAATIMIAGQDSDNASQFDGSFQDITSTTKRPVTSAVATWNPPAWVDNDYYQTPNLVSIVQEIVDRAGWASGNAMAFKFVGNNRRGADDFTISGNGSPVLFIEITPASAALKECPRYYGYFEPDSMYSYVGNEFIRDASGDWDGNWLNWLSMRRIDALRKVVMGGLATSRTGGGNTTLIGESNSLTFIKRHIGSGVSPYSGDYYFGVKDGYIYVDTDYYATSGEIAKFIIKVAKQESEEPDGFFEGNIAGVLQRVGDQARWGNMWFYYGTGSNQSGGYVANPIGTNMVTLITDLQNTDADTWTPLAETYYVAMQYFKQESVASGLDYFGLATLAFNNTKDPYYHDAQFIECAKSFVILLTDGASTKDRQLPEFLKDYDNDGQDSVVYASNGSDYLDDVALYARTNDLRDDLGGDQNLILYTVYAFDDDPNARKLLQDAARNGGFIDLNGNNRPDGDYNDPAEDRLEWDKDGDGIPDNYFEAQDGYELERKLIDAITDILKRASSGTAVSVLATSSEGEGTLVQAYFKPKVSTGVEEIDWVGYLQALWVDNQGRLREDTVQGSEPGLDPANDQIVEFFFDSASGEAKFYRFDVDANGEKTFTDTDGDGEKDADEDYNYSIHIIENLNPIWEAGELLADRDPVDRSIVTFVDTNGDGEVDEGEVVPFTSDAANVALIQNFLGVSDQTFLGGAAGDIVLRAKNLIKFIRGDHSSFEGTPAPVTRNRTMNGLTWKLSDIVHSTPVTIGRPLDNYGLIYGDSSYQAYNDKYRERESVVYVGANDGMLHAFLLGSFKHGDNPDTSGIVEVAYLDREDSTTENHGDELWAFIPQALLPHLKWLANPDYTHVYYVDLKPRIVDAQIFTPDPDIHPGGWGTVLICGLNFGGKDIDVEVSGSPWRTFKPSYFAIDITDPHNPQLLWERTYPELSLTTNIPTVARVGGKWFALLGSGPTEFNGTSDHEGHLYIADLLTGELEAQFDTGEGSSFMGSPITVDVGLNYNVDVAYIGESYQQGGPWVGKMYRLQVPILDQSADDPDDWVYESDPANWPASGFKSIFDADGPITAAPAASIDMKNRFWIYFGTGRFFGEADKFTTDTQYMYGIKDPFYNDTKYTDLGVDPASVIPLDPVDLVDSTDINVFTDQTVTGGPSGVNSWAALLDYMENKDGWFRELGQEAVYEGERVLNEAKILGGIVLTPTFIPNQDPCGFGGFSNLYGLYFETGTSYTAETFLGGSEDVSVDGETKTKVDPFIELGLGMGSSVGLHVGQEEGAKGYVQQSTGVVQDVDINPAFKVKSGLIYWREH
ncbi:MAG: hypothetical protein JRD68_01110 [Deltaproteobacteria bacterium]|nr:hypothetical protein [Deltaproteobacteria bacterium]